MKRKDIIYIYILYWILISITNYANARFGECDEDPWVERPVNGYDVGTKTGVTLFAHYKDAIFQLGGEDASSFTIYPYIIVYNMTTDNFTKLGEIPFILEQPGQQTYVYKTRAVIYGGYLSNLAMSDKLFTFDFLTLHWQEEIQINPIHPRGYGNFKGVENKVGLFSGRDNFNIIHEMNVLEIGQNFSYFNWSTKIILNNTDTSTPNVRTDYGLAIHNGSYLLIGGGISGISYNDFWGYSFETELFTNYTGNLTGEVPPLKASQNAQYGNLLYIVRGFEVAMDLFRLNLNTFEFKNVTRNVITPYRFQGMHTIYDGVFYLVGGGLFSITYPNFYSFNLNCQCDENHLGEFCEYHYCYGVGSNESTVCSRHGECLDNFTCICAQNYTGEDCNITTCFSIHSRNASVCSGHGICIGYDECQCEAEYAGTNCSIPLCDNLLPTNPAVCTGRGECISGNNCTCDSDLYFSYNCNRTTCYGVLSNSTSVCSGHGTCGEYNTCACFAHYYTDTCNLTSCDTIFSNDSSVCSGHGTCIGYNDCVCDANYFGSNCSIVKCNNTFSNSTEVCSGYGSCTHPETCECESPNIGSLCEVTWCFSKYANDSNVCSQRGTCSSLNHCDCFNSTTILGLECESCLIGYKGIFCNETIEETTIIAKLKGPTVMGTCHSIDIDGTESIVGSNETLLYSWFLVSGVDSYLSHLLVTNEKPYIYIPTNISLGSYEIGLRVSTASGLSSTNVYHQFEYVNQTVLTASILGPSSHTSFVSDNFVLYGLAINPCNALNEAPKYLWEQINGSFDALQGISVNQRNLEFVNGFPQYETSYVFKLTTYYENSSLLFSNSSTTTIVKTIFNNLLSKINDTSRVAKSETSIVLSTELSRDFDNITRLVDQFKFECLYQTNSSSLLNSCPEPLPSNFSVGHTTVRLEFSTSGLYHIKLIYKKGNRVVNSTQITYTVISAGANVFIPLISIDGPEQSIVNPNEKLGFRAIYLLDDDEYDDVLLTWSIHHPTSYPFSESNTLSGTINGPDIVLAPQTLKASISISYTIRLTALHLSTGASAFADMDIKINTPPTNGDVVIFPTIGQQLDTFFRINFLNWEDPQSPLTYELALIHPVSGKTIIIKPRSTTNFISIQFPQFGCSSNDFVITVVASIYDSFGVAQTVSRNVTVYPLAFTRALQWVKFANSYIPADYGDHGTSPPELVSIVPNVFELIRSVSGSVCSNCSELSPASGDVCIDSNLCIANAIWETPDYQTFQERAFIALDYAIQVQSISKLRIDTDSDFISLIESLQCLVLSPFSSNALRSQSMSFISNLTKIYIQRIPNPSINEMVNILAILTSSHDADNIAQPCIVGNNENAAVNSQTVDNLMYSKGYYTLMRLKQIMLSKLLPGEIVSPIVSTRFSLQAYTGSSSSFKVIQKLNIKAKNVSIGGNHLNVSPNVVSLLSGNSMLAFSLLIVDFDPYCHNIKDMATNLTHLSQSKFVQVDSYVDGQAKTLQYNLPLYQLVMDTQNPPNPETITPLTARSPLIKQIESKFQKVGSHCAQFDQTNGYTSTMCEYTLPSSSGAVTCECKSTENSMLSLFASNDIVTEVEEDRTLLIVLAVTLPIIGVLLLSCIICIIFICVLLIILKTRRKRTADVRQPTKDNYMVNKELMGDIYDKTTESFTQSDSLSVHSDISGTESVHSDMSYSSYDSLADLDDKKPRKKKKRKKKRRRPKIRPKVVTTRVSMNVKEPSPSPFHWVDDKAYMYDSEEDVDEDGTNLDYTPLTTYEFLSYIENVPDGVLEEIEQLQHQYDPDMLVNCGKMELGTVDQFSESTKMDISRDQLISSIPYFNRAVEVDPRHIGGLDHLAAVLRKLKKPKLALQYYRLSAFAGSSNAWLNIANLYQSSNGIRPRSISTVLNAYENASKQNPSSEFIGKKVQDYRNYIIDFICSDLKKRKAIIVDWKRNPNWVKEENRVLPREIAFSMTHLISKISSDRENLFRAKLPMVSRKIHPHYISNQSMIRCYLLLASLLREYIDPSNIELLRLYYEKACLLGSEDACFNLAQLYKSEGKHKLYKEMLVKAAEMGSHRAESSIASLDSDSIAEMEKLFKNSSVYQMIVHRSRHDKASTSDEDATIPYDEEPIEVTSARTSISSQNSTPKSSSSGHPWRLSKNRSINIRSTSFLFKLLEKSQNITSPKKPKKSKSVMNLTKVRSFVFEKKDSFHSLDGLCSPHSDDEKRVKDRASTTTISDEEDDDDDNDKFDFFNVS